MKYAWIILLFCLAGCSLLEPKIVEVPAPKQFDCSTTWGTWYCKSRVTNKCIKNEHVLCEEVPEEYIAW